MKQLITEAIVLRRIDYGEADRILTLLTSQHGKISAIAKGVRRPKSKLAGGVELFACNSITYIDGRHELKTLVSARVLHDYSEIVKSPDATAVAYDVLKYTQAYTESVCEDDYFVICRQSFASLCAGVPAATVLVWFAVRILTTSGHGINLESDSSGTKLNQDSTYNFDTEAMAFVADQTGRFNAQHIKLLRLCELTDIKSLVKIQNIQQLCDDLRQTMVLVLQYNSNQSL